MNNEKMAGICRDKGFERSMKTRIRAYSRDYYLWIYGLYHTNNQWDSDIPVYRGIYSNTKQALNKIYNQSLSELINKTA